jgi:hypothetical protein
MSVERLDSNAIAVAVLVLLTAVVLLGGLPGI